MASSTEKQTQPTSDVENFLAVLAVWSPALDQDECRRLLSRLADKPSQHDKRMLAEWIMDQTGEVYELWANLTQVAQNLRFHGLAAHMNDVIEFTDRHPTLCAFGKQDNGDSWIRWSVYERIEGDESEWAELLGEAEEYHDVGHVAPGASFAMGREVTVGKYHALVKDQGGYNV